MIIREYTDADCRAAAELFFDTVHTVNAADYTPEQLLAWAPRNMDTEAWAASFRDRFCLVAVEDGCLAGFADIAADGYLDRLYVAASCQRRGVATALCDRLERAAGGRVYTFASVTARPFFEKRGYVTLRPNEVIRRGVTLTNFLMEKPCF